MDSKQLVRDIYAMIDSGDFTRANELMAEDFVDHGGPQGEVGGLEGFQASVTQFRDAFSEGHSEIDLLITEGDLAAWRSTFTGMHTGVSWASRRPGDACSSRASTWGG